MLVFDASALDSLIDAYRPAYELWTDADAKRSAIALPSTVIWAVGRARGIGPVGWEPILFPTEVLVLPLSETAAVETCTWTGTLADCHTLWESRHLDWPIVTCRRELYGPDAKVLVI